ncbi:MAG: hypothetical protein R6X35_02345 [Candidatus Krumholzibacteriia bacterium]
MKPLLTLITILALAGAAAAQINHPYNEVGIYTVEDPDGCESAQIDVAEGEMFTAYLVLTNPWHAALGRPVTHLGAVEFRVELPAGLETLGMVWPSGTEVWPQWDGDAVEFLAGFMVPAPVIDGSITIIEFRFLASSAQPGFIYLQPHVLGTPSVPGAIAFTDADDGFSTQVMHPVSGSFDVPVFAINWDGELSFCATVPLRDESFGGLKALYR